MQLEAAETSPTTHAHFFVAADHVHVERSDGLLERDERVLRIGPSTEKAALFRVPGCKEHASFRTLAVSGGERVGFGDFEERYRARAVVIRAVEHTRRIGAVVVVMGRTR